MGTKRTRNGGGSVRKRPNGRYEARLSLSDGRRPSIYGKTEQEVVEKMTRMLSDDHRGLPVITKKLTVKEYLTDWLENGTTVGPTTKPGYCHYINKHIIPALGRIQLAKLTPQQVQAFIKAKQATDLTPRTVQYIYAILRKALNDALKMGLVSQNVATLIPNTPKVRQQEVEPLTPTEVNTLLKSIKGHRLEPLWISAMATGMRQGELLGLTWDNVDLVAGTVSIRRQLQRIDGTLQLVPTKTDRSRRVLNLPKVAVDALKMQRAYQIWESASPEWRGNALNLVFTTKRGTPLEASNVTHYFQKALKAAHVRHTTFHNARHTNASLLLAQGADLRTIMGVLGHSQITLTANTYTHLMPDLKRDAANRVDAAFAALSENTA